MWFTAAATPGPYIAPWGVYLPSKVVGNITWLPDGNPVGDSVVQPYIDVWSNVSSPAVQAYTVTIVVLDANGTVVAKSAANGTVAANGVTTWPLGSGIKLPSAALWHITNNPHLYTALVTLSVGGKKRLLCDPAPVHALLTRTLGARCSR